MYVSVLNKYNIGLKMANNIRNAGRKKALTTEQYKEALIRHDRGESITFLAKEFGVSRQTMSSYVNHVETLNHAYLNYRNWVSKNKDFNGIDLTEYSMRMDYMDEKGLCTAILIDFRHEKIKIRNTTDDIFHRAFGLVMNPDWSDFEEFLIYRTFPKERDMQKLVLKSIGLDYYDRLSIIEQTEGRMLDDNQWIRFYYYDKGEVRV